MFIAKKIKLTYGFWVYLLTISLVFNFATAQDKHDYYCSSSQPDFSLIPDAKSWMNSVPDFLKLSQLSIPGTHNSCALYGGIGGLAQCQSWPLAFQFEAGIRFIDIRCRRIDNGFTIHHGMVYQHITFHDVINICKKFLAENPSECIIMHVQEEYNSETTTKTFAEIFNSDINNDKAIWYTYSTIPVLQQVRGKIVLVTNRDDIGGINWNALNIQNDYNLSSILKIQTKWDVVKKQLNDAQGDDKNTWFINFTSASSTTGLVYPYVVAEYINYNMYDFLSVANRKKIGTILMDFPGEKLIQKIFRLNYRPVNGDQVMRNSKFYLENAKTHQYITKWYSGSSYYYPQYGQKNDAEPLFLYDVQTQFQLRTGVPMQIMTDNTTSMKSNWQSYNALTVFNDGVGYWKDDRNAKNALWVFELEDSSNAGDPIFFNDIVRIKNVGYNQYLSPYIGKNYLWTTSQVDDTTKWIIRSR